MGLSIERNVKEVNHSQFLDYTLLLGAASKVVVARFKKILDSYFSMSGGLVNKGKCQVYGWNCSKSTIIEITRFFELPTTPDWRAFKYLGIPIYLGDSNVYECRNFPL